jgi:hypothetical protein
VPRRRRRARPCENRVLARPGRASSPTRAAAPSSGSATIKTAIMDIERINAIGKSIADLTERTNALRGYL